MILRAKSVASVCYPPMFDHIFLVVWIFVMRSIMRHILGGRCGRHLLLHRIHWNNSGIKLSGQTGYSGMFEPELDIPSPFPSHTKAFGDNSLTVQ